MPPVAPLPQLPLNITGFEVSLRHAVVDGHGTQGGSQAVSATLTGKDFLVLHRVVFDMSQLEKMEGALNWRGQSFHPSSANYQ